MITANLQHGQNTSGGFDYAGQATLLASLADVVNAQEVSPGDLPNWDAAFTTLGFMGLYLVVGLLFLYLVGRVIASGPQVSGQQSVVSGQ